MLYISFIYLRLDDHVYVYEVHIILILPTPAVLSLWHKHCDCACASFSWYIYINTIWTWKQSHSWAGRNSRANRDKSDTWRHNHPLALTVLCWLEACKWCWRCELRCTLRCNSLPRYPRQITCDLTPARPPPPAHTHQAQDGQCTSERTTESDRSGETHARCTSHGTSARAWCEPPICCEPPTCASNTKTDEPPHPNRSKHTPHGLPSTQRVVSSRKCCELRAHAWQMTLTSPVLNHV